VQLITFEMDRGEAYSSNLRYLRQQILRAHASDDTDPFIVRIEVPDQHSLTLDAYLRPDDVYIYGIGNRESEFYFNDTPAALLSKFRALSDGVRLKDNQRILGFGGHYKDMGSYARNFVAADAGDGIRINRGTIIAALTQLARWQKRQEISNREEETLRATSEARHLQLLILMISEAARFPEIEQTIANALDGTPDSPLKPEKIQDLTHDWANLSGKTDLKSLKRVAIRTKSR
jgi:ribosome inactivating protein